MTERRVIAGRYTLLDRLASGGMATVHLGRMDAPGGFRRVVAIKRLHPHLADDPGLSDSFLDEARVASRIRHANVVPTLDVVAESGEIFLVMEYVAGASLADLLQTSGTPVPPPVAAKIMMDVLEGLHAAHEATDEHGAALQIVHRDISPHNVMIGTDGTARVLDFGIAKAIGRMQTTQDGSVKGKASYMSPEQVEGRPIDRRADVYAAGVTLWEILTARGLFPAATPMAAMMRAVRELPAPPSRYAKGISPRLDEAVLRALEKRPDSRFPTARAFADAIEAAQSPATTRTVARYLEDMVAALLRQRAQAVAAAAAGEPPSTTPEDRPPMTPRSVAAGAGSEPRGPVSSHGGRGLVPPPLARSSAARAVAVGLVVSVILAVALFVVRHLVAGSSIHPAEAARPQTSPPTSPLPATERPPAPTTAAPATPNTSAAPAAPAPPSSVATEAPTTTRPTTFKRRPAKTVSCDPPWTLDRDGVRVLKPECQ